MGRDNGGGTVFLIPHIQLDALTYRGKPATLDQSSRRRPMGHAPSRAVSTALHQPVRRAGNVRTGRDGVGGSYVHCHISSVGDNEAKDDEDCLRIIRRYLSYFPTNVYTSPPHVEPSDDPERRDEELLAIVPRNRKWPYNMLYVMRHLVDHGTLFELKPHFGNSVVTCLARMTVQSLG